MDYELRKQKMIHKSIEDGEIEVKRAPYVAEIDELRVKEAKCVKQINEAQEDLFNWAQLNEDY
jgi:hypothetical protein